MFPLVLTHTPRAPASVGLSFTLSVVDDDVVAMPIRSSLSISSSQSDGTTLTLNTRSGAPRSEQYAVTGVYLGVRQGSSYTPGASTAAVAVSPSSFVLSTASPTPVTVGE